MAEKKKSLYNQLEDIQERNRGKTKEQLEQEFRDTVNAMPKSKLMKELEDNQVRNRYKAEELKEGGMVGGRSYRGYGKARCPK